MSNKTILYWASQFIGWLLYYAAIGVNLFSKSQLNGRAATLLFAMYLGSILFTHILRNFFISQAYINLKIQQLIIRVLFTSVIIGTFLKLYQLLIDQTIIHFNPLPPNIREVIIDALGSSILIFLWTVFYFTYQYFDKSRREEIKNLEWKSLQNQIELNNLKSQLNPHFMFNALNSIRALVDINKQDAKDSITKLAILLRSSLLMGKKNVVTIEEEIELIKNYLDLEKIRFEERLQVEIEIAPNTLNIEIPPLMIQTIVENAIKHGISKRIDGGIIYLNIRKENDTCLIEVRNPGKITKNHLSENSIGLKNTKDRLNLMFGKNAWFILEQKNEDVVATISIKT